MIRTHLEEDLQLIQKYFPGARAVTLHTPFDLTTPEDRLALMADTFREEPKSRWYGGLLWTR
jgi:hypothetical protein